MFSFRSSLYSTVDFLLPPLCLGCDRPVTESQTLCAECWQNLNFITEPCCACCGVPFDFDVGGETLCGECHAQPPAYDAARSAFLYDEASRSLILRFKHADQTHGVPALARWMVRAGQSFWTDTDMIMPIPLHRWRLLKRRYNQSALLAQAIGKQVGVQAVVDGLLRTRFTPSQGRLNRKQRQKNVAGAFAVNPKVDVMGQTITLIDDVMTSGATVEACAKLLRKKGAAKVYVVSLARVSV